MPQTVTEPLQAATGLSPDDLASLRRALIEEQERLLAECRRDLAAAQAIRVEEVQDLEELAAMDLDQDLLFAHSEQSRETLLLIEEVLQRMNEGIYGICA